MEERKTQRARNTLFSWFATFSSVSSLSSTAILRFFWYYFFSDKACVKSHFSQKYVYGLNYCMWNAEAPSKLTNSSGSTDMSEWEPMKTPSFDRSLSRALYEILAAIAIRLSVHRILFTISTKRVDPDERVRNRNTSSTHFMWCIRSKWYIMRKKRRSKRTRNGKKKRMCFAFGSIEFLQNDKNT